MPIYELKTPGADKPRLIKAKDVSEALTFAKVADIKPANAERLSELFEEGVVLEKVPDKADPASYAPGGALHKDPAPTAKEKADAPTKDSEPAPAKS